MSMQFQALLFELIYFVKSIELAQAALLKAWGLSTPFRDEWSPKCWTKQGSLIMTIVDSWEIASFKIKNVSYGRDGPGIH